MKYVYTIIFGLFFGLIGYSQIINIPDANFKAKLLESDSGVPIAYGNGGSFKIDANNNGEIEVNEVLPVRSLHIRDSNISDLTGIEYFINMTQLRCETNSLTELDVTMLSMLQTLGVYDNELTDLNVAGLSNLQNIYASRNLLSSVDLTGLIELSRIDIDGNDLASLDFSDTPNLHFIDCFDNQLTTLDVSPLLELYIMDCSSNQLETLNIKNGFSEPTLDFSGNNSLQFICADDSEIMSIQNKINDYGYTNCFINSLCSSFIEGEDFYTISGHVTYDEGANGCDSNDIDYPELLFNLTDGSNSAITSTNAFGYFTYSLQAGMYTLAPSLENTTYFNITPESINANFPADANANFQEFCVSANGVYPDLKITMTNIDDEYDTLVTYSLIYTNQGTMTQSGNVSLTYGDDMAVFSSSVPDISGHSANELFWVFSDLKSFESREIKFTMNVSCVESEGGEILVDYVTTIASSLTDTTPNDNVFEFNEPLFCGMLNTNEFSFSDYFSLYPNPAEEYLNLKLKKEIDVKAIVIYNVLGQEVKKLAIKNDHIKIDVSNLEADHYFIKIVTPEKVFNTRLIKN
ncbi:hypothetical protein PK35_06830 [Tamlana nanhaiensis]|uniref:Secretion system C-terminal sorting domain-containing protein n=1 Tax=Neotamlana nanhaiensis TaxID=1382798 RepID=A0A0D7W6U5_9FLAO|nr:T9SS type A sorting domain-containing protein [Tamlana nanhaiensis]KJD33552.1 hypothetical protein PK35_06830 [Tamlana nanhaiensis]